MIGIYKFTNKITGEAYIGQSTNIKKRYNAHHNRYLFEHNHEDTYFHKMLRHYGFNNFEFEIIEECTASELNDKEIYYIAYYNTLYPNGYNRNPGGNTPTYHLDDEVIYGIIEDLKNSDLTGMEIADKYHVHFNTVSQINIGHSRFNENIKYPIRDNKARKEYYCSDCGTKLQNKTKTGLCKSCYVKQKHLDSNIPNKDELYNLLLRHPFTEVADRFDVSDNAVRKWCDKYDIPRHSSYYREVKLQS